MNLKIFSWNCQSLKGKMHDLSRILVENYSNPYHIVLLQETWLNPKVSISAPKNYTIIRNDRVANSRYPHGGVAILIHSSIKFKQIKFCQLKFYESIFIEIRLNAKSIIIGSVYCSSSLKTSESKSDIRKLLSRPEPFILAGDWNAKHEFWNNSSKNSKGIDLLKAANDTLSTIHFPDEPTCIPATGQPSILDFVISKKTNGIIKPSVYNDFNSDHVPITFEVVANIHISPTLKIRNWKQANWKKFQSVITCELESRLCHHENLSLKEEIDKQISSLKIACEIATNESVPLKFPPMVRYTNSDKIRKLILERNKVRKNISRFPTQKKLLNELNREIKKETNILKQIEWNKRLRSLNTQDLSLYKFAKNLKKQNVTIPPLKNGIDLIFSDKGKAELIAESLAKAHEISEDATCHTNSVENSIQNLQTLEIDFPFHERVTLNELKSHIESLNIVKANGIDGISNRVVKHFPVSIISFLVQIFNKCFKIGYFPLDWKIGKIVAIPKPGKDPSLPESYRPITLLPVIGKIFEKCIGSRLSDHEKNLKVLVDQQLGFREKLSTDQQVVRLTETISMRFNEDRSTALVTLDVEKAFDKVWHDALIHKLKMYDFPIFLIKIIYSFLKDRKSLVSINGKPSKFFCIKAGTPQGSPISPFLFTIFINDIPVPKYCKLGTFADDTALLASINNFDLPKLTHRLDSGLEEIQEYTDSWKITLNVPKTEAILFTHSRKMKALSITNKVKFKNVELEWKDSLRYLGIWLDPKLTFGSNIAKNVVKAKKAMAILYPLLKKQSPLNTEGKITIYRSYIRPIMTYACPVFDNSAKCHIKKLQTVQNKCLRMVLNAPLRTRIKTLHDRTNLPMLDEFIGKLTENFYIRSSYSNNKLISRLGDYTRLPSHIRRKHKLPKRS
jgi:Reverse transcriptase (RNA-dependent DNA polymerase)/Endonuclease-reverse transcriptase